MDGTACLFIRRYCAPVIQLLVQAPHSGITGNRLVFVRVAGREGYQAAETAFKIKK